MTGRKGEGKNSLRTNVDMEDLLARKTGTRITDLDGFGVTTVLTLLCEVGRDLSRFPDAGHFAAYLGFVPRNKITGGVILPSKTDRIKHPASIALKSVVPSLSQTDSPPGIILSFRQGKKWHRESNNSGGQKIGHPILLGFNTWCRIRQKRATITKRGSLKTETDQVPGYGAETQL